MNKTWIGAAILAPVAWIKTVAPNVAEGELKEIYDAIGAARSGVAEVHCVQSLNPHASCAP